MGDLFNPEKGLWHWLGTLVDVCGLSLLWTALCLPVVTIGPATAALYLAVVKCVRKREGRAFKTYLRSFRENLRVGIPATLIALVAVAVVVNGYLVMASSQRSNMAFIMLAAYYVFMLVPLGITCYLFPLLGRFTFGVRGLFRTAFQLSMRHLPSTVVVVLLTVQMVSVTIRYWVPVLFTPAVTILLVSLFFERIFVRYAPELAEEATGEE